MSKLLILNFFLVLFEIAVIYLIIFEDFSDKPPLGPDNWYG